MISVPRDTSAFDMYYGGWAESGLKLNELVNKLDQRLLQVPGYAADHPEEGRSASWSAFRWTTTRPSTWEASPA